MPLAPSGSERPGLERVPGGPAMPMSASQVLSGPIRSELLYSGCGFVESFARLAKERPGKNGDPMLRLQQQFKCWLESDYSPQTFVRTQELRLPGRRNATTISVLAQPDKAGFHLVLDLWKVVPGTVREFALAALA